MLEFLGSLLGAVPAKIADYFNEKQKIDGAERIRRMELEDALHQRRIELIREGLHADANWEVEQIRNSGWKDEYVLGLLSIPLVLCFIPATAPWVLAGFAVLATTPGWYQFLIVSVFAAIYGIRVWRRQQSDT